VTFVGTRWWTWCGPLRPGRVPARGRHRPGPVGHPSLPGRQPGEVGTPGGAGAPPKARRSLPDLQFLIALAPSIDPAPVRTAFAGCDARLVSGQTHAALGSATVALVASGTATVEAALLGVPMVVVYRVSRLTYGLGRRLVNVPHYAMVNLIAGRAVVPELMQSEFTSDRVAAEAGALLDDPGRREAMKRDLDEVRRRLGAPGASGRAAAVVADALADLKKP
jgi:lipid-A-disaccharide synthase